MGIRKNASALTAAERAAYVAAVKALKAQSSGQNYDWFVRVHMQYFSAVGGTAWAHTSPSFLPWHRQYLILFENALKAHDPSVNIPYWDWTVNQSMTGVPWTSDFMGGNGTGSGGTVATGPFAGSAQWRINYSSTSGTSLRRAMGGTLPSASNVNTVLGISTYDAAPWNSSVSTGMRNRMEGFNTPNIHNRVHVWVGGHMNQTDSPNDPVFFLHHCNIDRLWSQWQTRWGFGAAQYQPGGGTSNVVDVNESMQPFGVTVNSVLNHTPLYTYA